MSSTQIRGNKQIQSGSITNVEIAANAAIALSKIAGGTDLNLRVTDLESDALVTREVPSGSVNGSNASFTLANTPVSGSELVFINGILAEPGDAYTISGSSITFLPAPQSGDEIHVTYKTDNYVTAPGDSDGGLGGGGASSSVNYGTLASGDDTFSIGDNCSAAVRSNGTLLTWGAGHYGQLGHGLGPINRLRPTQLGSDSNWAKVCFGKFRGSGNGGLDRFRIFCLALKTNGTLWAWGVYEHGQVGNGSASNSSVSYDFLNGSTQTSPVQIGSDANWSKIATGIVHALAIKTDGTLWTWGYNGQYQLGDGTTTQRNAPVQIGSDTDWVAISASGSHSIALKSNGTLWAWGDNTYGQLGIGGGSRSVPTQVGSDTDWSKISTAGGGAIWPTAHSLAIKTNGTLWSWGYNGYGQLAQGDASNRTSPTQVGSDTNWGKICAGDLTSFAIKTSGALYACGYNAYGQLGDGTAATRNSFVQIGSATDWDGVYSDFFNTMARKTDGTLHAWGVNEHGQLGDGSFVQKYGPAKAEVDLDV